MSACRYPIASARPLVKGMMLLDGDDDRAGSSFLLLFFVAPEAEGGGDDADAISAAASSASARAFARPAYSASEEKEAMDAQSVIGMGGWW